MVRAIARLTVALALGVALVGVPTVLAAALIDRAPDLSTARGVMLRGRLDDSAVIAVGIVVFLLLWMWFAVSAVAECVAVLRWRASRGRASLQPIERGPQGWVRSVVRFAALSGASAGVAVASMAGVGVAGAAPPAATVAAAEWAGHSEAGPIPWHGVDTGGGDVVGVAATGSRDGRTTPPSVIATNGGDVVDGPLAGTSGGLLATSATTGGLAGAVMFTAGALVLLESARRQRLRSALRGARLDAPSLDRVRTEMALRRVDGRDRLLRLDLALRSVAAHLVDAGVSPAVVVIDERGGVRLWVCGDPNASLGTRGVWEVDAAGCWHLSAAVSNERLAASSRSDAHPCPAIAHIGRTDEGECFVDLESLGVLEIASSRRAEIIEAVHAAMSVSPFLPSARLVSTVRFRELDSPEPDDDDDDRGPCAPLGLDEALDVAAGVLGAVAESAEGSSTFARRVRTEGVEAWEPCVVLVESCTADEVSMARRIVRPGTGLAVIVGADPGSSRVGASEWRLVDDAGTFGSNILEPIGLRVRVPMVPRTALAEVRDVIEHEHEPIVPSATLVPMAVGHSSTEPFVEQRWSIMVRLLGPVDVVTSDGTSVQFEKSKSQELVAWLALHRRRPTRSAARAALWDVEVKDSTFANVVSDARRALAKATGSADDEWIGRTLTDALPLHPEVVSDGELLEARLRHAARLGAREAIDVLTPAVELIVGMPFAGTGYLWCDSEGHSSSLVMLAVEAASQLARHHLALGDVEGVFWATGQGLLVLNGHEELIALRMRAHADRGDLSGVRAEWERYERALQADPWTAAEPSPKLAALRRELLANDRGVRVQ